MGTRREFEGCDVDQVAVLLQERLRGVRPRLQAERDEFGHVVDWTWYSRRGYLYIFDDKHLAVTVESPQTAAALRQLGRWPVIQDGDWETTFLVPDAEFADIAPKVGPYQRP